MRKSIPILTNLLLALLVTLALFERGLGEEVTVSFGETVHAQSSNIDLTFESLSEGRCPGDVLCIWEGCATIGVIVTTDTGSYNIILPIMGTVVNPMGRSLAPIDAFDFRFTLMQLLPYPMIQDSVTNDDYEAVIRIEPLPQTGGVDGSVVIANSQCAKFGGLPIAVDSTYLSEKILGMEVSYSGGCFDHYFMLHWDDYQINSDIDTVYLSVRIDPFEDPCDAWITEQLAFDLSSAIEYYEEIAGGPQVVVFSVGGETVTYDPFFCCKGTTGNVDGDIADICDIADLTYLIDYLFINFPPLDCPAEANIDGDSAGDVDIADLTALIDFLFINGHLSPCGG